MSRKLFTGQEILFNIFWEKENQGENYIRLSELLNESINILSGFMYKRINLARTCIGLLYNY